MLISICFQIRLIFFSLVAGIFTGILFDIYRLLRGLKNPNKYITFVEDVLFWILGSILVFLFLLYTDYAYVSIYIYLIIFLGIVIYIKFFSDIIISILIIVFGNISRALRILGKCIVFPFNILTYNLKHRKK